MDCAGRVRVVVVEDQTDLRELLVFALETSGFEVQAAASMHEARALLEGRKDVDVLVADYTLPDGSGSDLVELCEAARPRLCILLSGHDARDLPGDGFDVVLTKPVLPEKLVAAIRARFPER